MAHIVVIGAGLGGLPTASPVKVTAELGLEALL
jgi:NADH dehydrogenase FAD-containing subunit